MYCMCFLVEPVSDSINYNVWYREMSVYADCLSSRLNIAVESNHLVVHVHMQQKRKCLSGCIPVING
jgi:hypothetical protein